MAATAAAGNGWNTSLFNYGAYCGKCICAMCFPMCAAARARTAYDNSSCCFNCMCLTPCAIRNIVREGYAIVGDCMEDMCFTFYFQPCVIAQFWNEVERRGPLAKGPLNANWSGGLCSCCDYPGTCMYAMLCPACAAATERSNYDESNCLFNACCVGGIAAYNIVREGYNIQGTCCFDVIVMACISPCGVVQMHREIKTRGKISRNAATGANPPQPKQMF